MINKEFCNDGHVDLRELPIRLHFWAILFVLLRSEPSDLMLSGFLYIRDGHLL